MIPQYRGNYPQRGRGFFSNRGGRGQQQQDRVISQMGNKKLIASNIASKDDEMYKEFLAFKASKEGNNQASSSSAPSYAKVITEEEDDSSYEKGNSKEVIILLQQKDLQWKNDPWQIMQRYLDTASFPACSYKQRNTYENILSSQNCEITHFFPTTTKQVYNFSKIIIKKVILPEEWGLSTLKEKEFIYKDSKIIVKFNYWDYIQAFEKALFYENYNHKHSWFIKICAEVYKHELPTWLCQWWIQFGPSSVKILPEPFIELYSEWLPLSQKIKDLENTDFWFEGIALMHFFIEFSIPWIYKWVPEVGYTQNNLPCINRISYSKFWKKLLINDEQGILYRQDLIDNIKATIDVYKHQEKYQQAKESPSPFQHVSRKLQMKKGILSKEEIISSYFEEMKKDLKKNLDIDLEDSDLDVSMSSILKSDEDDCEENLAGYSQDPNEVHMEEDKTLTIFEGFEDFVKAKLKEKNEASSSSTKASGK